MVKKNRKQKIRKNKSEDEETRKQRIEKLSEELSVIQEECTDKETGKRKISDYEDDRANHLSAELVKLQGIVFDKEIRKQVVAKLVEEFRYLRNGGREKCKN